MLFVVFEYAENTMVILIFDFEFFLKIQNLGWAALPEYNPPSFAVDSSFQRHVQRHANKLLTRVYHLQILYRQVIVEKEADIMEQDKAHNEIQLSIPMIGDPPTDKWDIQCDKSFLIGIFKHGKK